MRPIKNLIDSFTVNTEQNWKLETLPSESDTT